MSLAPGVFLIAGRQVTLPVRIHDATTYFAQFPVPAPAAQALIAYSGMEVAQPFPGVAICALGFVKYVAGDLGQYDEVAVAFLVRTFGAARTSALGRVREVFSGNVGAFIHRLPVNQSFTLEAGRTIWGFPKFLADIDVTPGDRSGACHLAYEGRDVLRLRIARGMRVPGQTAGVAAYSFRDGVLRRTKWQLEADRYGASLGGAELSLGDHPIADELRSLGLPKRAIASGSLLCQRSTFFAAEVVAGGRDAPTNGVHVTP